MLLVNKTILRQFLPVFSLVLFVSACTDKSNTNEVIKALEESLVVSNSSINTSSFTIMKSIEEKKTEYATKERADIWFAKAEQIVNLSSDAYNYIGSLKKIKDINSEKTKKLFARLIKYKEDVLKVDSLIRYEFAKSFILISNSFDSLVQTEKKLGNKFFKNSNSTAVSAMLTKLQNSIKVIENKAIAYCHQKIGSTDGHPFFESYSGIVGQNSTILKPGEELEIKAGIGLFSYQAHPNININGKNIEIGDGGYALSKTKVTAIPGKYKIPVIISFLNQVTGREETMKVNVKYTVVKECN
jgi:hypothetical protein